jgi:hypothetical protein
MFKIYGFHLAFKQIRACDTGLVINIDKVGVGQVDLVVSSTILQWIKQLA